MFFFWIFACDLVIPVILLLAGWLMLRHPPKHINDLVGYRTRRSCRNMDTWRFAHRCCGRLWLRLGAVLLPLSAAVHLPFLHAGDGAVAILSLAVAAVQLSFLLGSIYFVERALKARFDENGLPRA
mgnify:CR=1 FL=1